MIWNPWRECRRLREELAKLESERAKLQYRNEVVTWAYHQSVQRVVFLCHRTGLEPDMIQVDDYGEVRLALPPDVETRGTA